MRRVVCLLIALAALSVGSAQDIGHVPGSVLADDEGWQLVYAHCSACHSLRLVVGQRGDRDTWLRRIRWMQETQNLWQFDPSVESRILDYLAKNYASDDWVRRAPLPDHLLP